MDGWQQQPFTDKTAAVPAAKIKLTASEWKISFILILFPINFSLVQVGERPRTSSNVQIIGVPERMFVISNMSQCNAKRFSAFTLAEHYPLQ